MSHNPLPDTSVRTVSIFVFLQPTNSPCRTLCKFQTLNPISTTLSSTSKPQWILPEHPYCHHSQNSVLWTLRIRRHCLCLVIPTHWYQCHIPPQTAGRVSSWPWVGHNIFPTPKGHATCWSYALRPHYVAKSFISVQAFFAFHMHAGRLFHGPTFLASLDLHPSDPRFPFSTVLHAMCAVGSLYTADIPQPPIQPRSHYPRKIFTDS